MKHSTKKPIRRLIAIILLILGGYYLLVSVGVIPSNVVLGDYSPDNRILAIVSILLIALGLLIDDIWRTKIKNALS